MAREAPTERGHVRATPEDAPPRAPIPHMMCFCAGRNWRITTPCEEKEDEAPYIRIHKSGGGYSNCAISVDRWEGIVREYRAGGAVAAYLSSSPSYRLTVERDEVDVSIYIEDSALEVGFGQIGEGVGDELIECLEKFINWFRNERPGDSGTPPPES